MNCHSMNNTSTQNDEEDDVLSNIPIYDFNDDLDTKENVLSFSFDHIYAITPDNVTFLPPSRDIAEECSTSLEIINNQKTQAQLEVDSLKTQLKKAQTELVKLKKLASVHLDLIQKQSDLLTLKDKYNKALLLENETLRTKNNRQRQIQPTLVNLPTKVPNSKSLLIPDVSQQQPNKLRKPISDPSQPSTSGYVIIKKPSQINTSKSEIYRSDQIKKESIAQSHLNKANIEYYTTQGRDNPIYTASTGLTLQTPKKEIVDCKFDKTSIDIYSIVKSSPQVYNSIDTAYGATTELDCIKIKEEAVDNDDIFDRLSDNDCTPYQKIEKSCRDFSYGESLTNINSGVLSTLSDTKGSSSHKTVPWWPQTTNMVAPDYNDTIETRYEINMKKRISFKGKGKGKGKKSQPSDFITKEDTTNSLIRNMFIASDVSDIPEKISPTMIDEPKVKNRFFRSKLGKDTTNNIIKTEPLQDDPNTVYRFDPLEDQKKVKIENYRSDVDIFDFCISQQEMETVLPEIPVEQKKKKHIYDPPTNIDIVKEPKRATSPSASVYSFEDSQETKILDNKGRDDCLDSKVLKHLKSRAFGLFGTELNDLSVDTTNIPVQRVTCYMNAAKGCKKETSKVIIPNNPSFSTNNSLFDLRRGRRKSATSNSSIRGSMKNSKTRCRANSLFYPNNPSYQRDRSFVRTAGRGRQRAQSTGSHTSVGSRSKSSCDVNIAKLNSDLEFKNRSFAMMSQPEYDFVNVSKFEDWKGQETTPINTLEVPKWRIKTLKPAKISKSDQEEKMDDIVFAKRHSKMELEEKRIKRWDYQRLKELHHLKKLKERQEKLTPGGKKIMYRAFKQRKVIPQSLWPTSEDILAIEVVDKLPVSSFGELVPYYKPRKFSLPWIKKKRLHSEKAEQE